MSLIKRVFLQFVTIVLLICSTMKVQPVEANPEINCYTVLKISQTHTKQRSTCLIPMSLPKAGDAKASLSKMRRIGLSPEQYQMKTIKEKSSSIMQKKTSQKDSSKHTKSNAENISADKEDIVKQLYTTDNDMVNHCSQVAKLPQHVSNINLLYSLVQAEAGNQDVDGCRLVADVVLNRIDSNKFPNDLESVIYSPGQFSVVRNGALKKAQGEISEKVVQAVDMELSNTRLDNTVLYFNNSNNGGWKYGDHWFK